MIAGVMYLCLLIHVPMEPTLAERNTTSRDAHCPPPLPSCNEQIQDRNTQHVNVNMCGEKPSLYNVNENHTLKYFHKRLHEI